MTGTIEQITGNGTWQSTHGLMYSFHYLINGVTYQMNHKTATPPFKEGEVLNFNITRDGGEHPSTISKIRDEQPQQASPPQNQTGTFPQTPPPIDVNKSIVLQVCIKAAAEHTAQRNDTTLEQAADRFYQWYQLRMSGEVTTPPPVEKVAQVGNLMEHDGSHDLPF